VEGIMDNVADTPEKKERYIKTIYKKARDMDQLVNELSVFSKIDSDNMTYNMEVIPICGYFDDCADELSMDAESHGFDFVYDNKLDRDVQVEMDPEQMTRVINNIVNNSFKYAKDDNNKIELRLYMEDEDVAISFKDNGKGISPKDAERIFERFFRTDESRGSATGGSGIGLSIVQKVVEAHGGAVSASGELGKGMEIKIILPLYDANSTDKKHKVKDENVRSSKLNNILNKKISERK
jgi:signal transduction histidine kinase